MSNPSILSCTARPDGSGRWDNREAAQQLPRGLVRPSSGLKELAQNKKKKYRHLQYVKTRVDKKQFGKIKLKLF